MNTLLTIVVAAGKGERMGGGLPKQFLLLDGKPIIMHTLERLHAAVQHYLSASVDNPQEIVEKNVHNDPAVEKYVERGVEDPFTRQNTVHKSILLLPGAYLSFWEELCKEHRFDIPHLVVEGGDNRFESVRNGLNADIERAGLILVHDGVRPFPSDRLIGELIGSARQYGAAIPACAMTDSVRELSDPSDRSGRLFDRARLRTVQTPQAFRGELLRNAYRAEYDPRMTDDTSVVETMAGVKPVLVEGETSNIKITSPFDLEIAAAYLRSLSRPRG